MREALHGLITAGFVERQGKKLVVVDPHLVPANEVDYGAFEARASVQEVFATRKLLEVEGARLAARHRTAEDLVAMREILGRMDPADPVQYHGLRVEFHAQMMAASGNGILNQVYQASRELLFKRPAFWRVFGTATDESGRPAPVGGGPRSHELLFQAIEAGDPDEAARLCAEHLDRLQRVLVDRVQHSARLAAEQGAPSTH
ncbi:hypothetical protein BJF78_30305 [Pseudonocardia sp. CNS-139]|nr:hypothetical protein BJF78_30305 [Pseudonocardia sp. CNS-139]